VECIGWLAVEVMGKTCAGVVKAVEAFLETLQTIYMRAQRVLGLDSRGPSGLDPVSKDRLMRVYLFHTGAPSDVKLDKREFVGLIKQCDLIGHLTISGEPLAVSHVEIIWTQVTASARRRAAQGEAFTAGAAGIDPRLFATFVDALTIIATKTMNVNGAYPTSEAALMALLHNHIMVKSPSYLRRSHRPLCRHSVLRLLEMYRYPLLHCYEHFCKGNEVGGGLNAAQHTEEHATMDSQEFAAFTQQKQIVPQLVHPDTAQAFFCESHLLLETSSAEDVGVGVNFQEWLAILDMIATCVYAATPGESEYQAMAKLLQYLGIWDKSQGQVGEEQEVIEDHLQMDPRQGVPLDTVRPVASAVAMREPALLPDVCNIPSRANGQVLPPSVITLLSRAEAIIAENTVGSDFKLKTDSAIQAFIQAARECKSVFGGVVHLPLTVHIWARLGMVYEVLGQDHFALASFIRSHIQECYMEPALLSCLGVRVSGLAGMARCLFRRGAYSLALQYCGEVVRLRVDCPADLAAKCPAYNNLGACNHVVIFFVPPHAVPSSDLHSLYAGGRHGLGSTGLC
jgi:hypothetical protein